MAALAMMIAPTAAAMPVAVGRAPPRCIRPETTLWPAIPAGTAKRKATAPRTGTGNRAARSATRRPQKGGRTQPDREREDGEPEHRPGEEDDAGGGKDQTEQHDDQLHSLGT